MTAKKITRRTFLGTTAVGAASTSLSLNTWAQAINNQKSPLINGSIPALEDDVKVLMFPCVNYLRVFTYLNKSSTF